VKCGEESEMKEKASIIASAPRRIAAARAHQRCAALAWRQQSGVKNKP
jgi:hypothetical protein